MSISKIKSIGRQPLNVMVYENIKNAIVAGDLEPGTRLTETKVGEQLNVSTTPVREAFRRLASEGLLKIIPWRGAIVQEFSDRELLEVYQCREVLEVLSIKSAMDHLDEAGIKKLENLVEQSILTTTISEHVEINSSIHQTILEYAQNEMLASLIGQLNDVIYHNRNMSSYNEKRRYEIYNEHLQIIQAIKEGDKQKAQLAMEIHVKNGYTYIIDRLKKKET